MSAISDAAAKLNAVFDRVDAAAANLQGDVKFLQDTIAALQASQGTVTPEDQALIDALETRAGLIAANVETLAAITPDQPPTL